MTSVNKNIFYLLLVLGMIGFGASWVNVKVLANYINEYETMLIRFVITAISLIPIILYLKKSFKINIKSFILILISSIVFVAYMKYYFLGTMFGTVGLGGAFVMTLIPINTFIILGLLGEKRITKKDSIALSIGAIGVIIMLNMWTFKMEEIFAIHNIYFMIASILWPIITIISSKATNISPIVFTFYLYVITCILNLIFFVDLTLIDYDRFDYVFWINMLCLSIFASTFSYTIYFLGIEKFGARNISSFLFLVPFFAIVFGIIFLDEKIDFSIIIGTIFTLIAVMVLNNIKIFKNINLNKTL
ncbi:MAG: DMT family transporter [Campylobacteraceae bacterium]|nr:DMT family transporter [Campylobacteraceae bacterium]